MLGLVWIAVIALFVWAGYRLSRADARLQHLERRLARLEAREQAAPVPAEASATRAVPTPVPPAAALEPDASEARPAAARPAPPEPGPAPSPPPRAPRPSPAARLLERWRPLERQLIENWTGILGAALLVAGVAFLGIYSALFVGPLPRTLMIAATAGLLAAGYALLRERSGWEAFAIWLRSAGAAIFLFACFGAVAIDGLRWIGGAAPALATLSVGIAANLYLAFAGGSQRFAALHTVLSLIPLAIIPAGPLPFALATLVALFGVALAYRGRWDLHLLVTLGAFAVFQLDWLLGLAGSLGDLDVRALGASGPLVVGGAAALVHYRKEYESRHFDRLPFAVHLANWLLLGGALSYYTRGTPARGIALFAAAAVAYGLSRRGKRLGIRWAHLLDTLIAQGLVVGGIVSFYPWTADWLLVPLAAFAQTALYLRVVAAEDERLLDRAGLYLLHGAALLLALGGLLGLGGTHADRLQDGWILLLASGVALARHHFFLRAHGEGFDPLSLYLPARLAPRTPVSALGVAVGMLLASSLACLHDRPWMPALALIAAGATLYLARRSEARGLALGGALALAAAHLLGWGETLAHLPAGPGSHLARLVPLLALAATGFLLGGPDPLAHRLRRAAVWAGALDLGLAAYALTEPASPLIPGVLWLCLSLAALEAALRLRSAVATSLLHAGYAYAAAFALGYVLVYMQSGTYLGPLPARVALEGFGLMTFALWFAARPSDALAGRRSWTHVQPWFLEAFLVLAATSLTLAIAVPWRPTAWGAAALAVAWGPAPARARRLRFYALLLFWACALDLAAVTSLYQTPAPRWWQQPATAGLVAIAVQIGFILRAHGKLDLASASFPPGLGALARWTRAVAAREAVWTYYPFFFCVAVFLFWRFDRAVLTLLWAAEAFVVFALSAILRENHFRYLALSGLAACLVRLVLWDLEQTGTLMRGLVFLGVGILMLGMNSIYSRFRTRFE